MNIKSFLSALIAFILAMIATPVRAEDFDCFPICAVHANPPAAEVMCPEGLSGTPSQNDGAIEKVEVLNNQLKPVKEIIGYVHSPQSLAMKLVNDYIVKIPAWVGYVMDPLGSLKNKAMSQVRDHLKTAARGALSHPDSCRAPEAVPLDEPITPATVTVPLVEDVNAI